MSETLGECAGCGRSSAQARKLLSHDATPGILICDRCVAECADAMASSPTRIPGAARPCGFCTKTEDQVAVMIAIGARMICDDCVDQFRARLQS